MWNPIRSQPAVLQIGNCSKNSLLLVLKQSTRLLKGAAACLGPPRGPGSRRPPTTVTAPAAATGFLSQPPGPLHTPQRLSLNGINYRSSFPVTVAYRQRVGTLPGCLVMRWWWRKLLEPSSPNFASGQPYLSVLMPTGVKTHRGRDQWAPRAVSARHGGGRRPPSSPKVFSRRRPGLTPPGCAAPGS